MPTTLDHANTAIHDYAPGGLEAAADEIVAVAATLGDGHVLSLRSAARALRECGTITDRASAAVAIEAAAQGFDAAQDASVWARHAVGRGLAFRLSAAAWACIYAANAAGWVREISVGTFMPAGAAFRAKQDAALAGDTAAAVSARELPPGMVP